MILINSQGESNGKQARAHGRGAAGGAPRCADVEWVVGMSELGGGIAE
jgi:hypothetical protein